jgi:hypothetical protein
VVDEPRLSSARDADARHARVVEQLLEDFAPEQLPALEHRCELKLPVRHHGSADVWRAIRCHPLGFEALYPDRGVHNLYFDTPGLAAYAASLEGAEPRLKLRLRWYGESDDVREGRLEWKWRRGPRSWKWSTPVAWSDDLLKLRWSALRDELRRELDGRQRATFDAMARPVLLNRYLRSYFVSRDGSCRLTHDRQLVFAAQLGARVRPGVRPLRCWGLEVLEIKTAAERPDVAERALRGFPFHAARFSKYAAGVGLAFHGVP